MILAGLSLLTLFVVPMWRIKLIAPQYPDGVEMHIWINKIGGDSPSSLQNINILNHYIGMKYIEPESIPELKYMPIIIIGFVVAAFLAALTKRKTIYLIWAISLVLVSILGFYDFYLWEYDYGHSLSDTAPIKIPGASFQPPLFGSKDIISFTAKSFPHIGGYFAGLAIFLGFAAWWLKSKMDRNERVVSNNNATDRLAKRMPTHV